MTKLDLKDVTFTIPVRIESEDRKRNLKTVIQYMVHHLDTNIIILVWDQIL